MASRASTGPRRYAEAAFQLAMRDKQLDAYADGLDQAAAVIRDGDVVG